jgi:hypothetical protein
VTNFSGPYIRPILYNIRFRNVGHEPKKSDVEQQPKSSNFKVVQIWPGLIVCKQVTVCTGHIWTTLYKQVL